MTIKIQARAAAPIALLFSLAAGSHATEDQLTPVLARVLTPPAATVQTDGRWQLPYELVLTNITSAPMTIEALEARDPDREGLVVHSLTDEMIAPSLALLGGVSSSTLGPGQSGVLFVNASFERREDVPKRLAHRLVITSPDPKPPLPKRTVQDVAPSHVEPVAPAVLGPPLRGHGWVAAASCCEAYHRRAVLAVNGARHVAQRFAIDWLQLDAEARLATGDPTRNESFPQFGAEAVAVADAKVAHVHDGLPDGQPGSFPPAVTAATANGNHVVLDLGAGRWALYAHLQPGSLRVKRGDRVERGHVLGLVGSSGNSDAPHLHFQVMDSPSPLASNGLPYVIDSFELRGNVASSSDLNDELEAANEPVSVVPTDGPTHRTNQLPADRALVDFP